MEKLNKDNLHPWLKTSLLMKKFENEILIPKRFIITKKTIDSFDDFYHMMNSLRFFMIEELPFEIYDYCKKYKPDLSNFKDFFFGELLLHMQSNEDLFDFSNVSFLTRKEKATSQLHCKCTCALTFFTSKY